MRIEWSSVETSRPLVVDNLRETIGINLCHKRSQKGELQAKYQDLDFEDGFPEEDELHLKSQKREEIWEQFMRINGVLQDLFSNELQSDDTDDVVSITCHAGTIRAFLSVVGHRGFTIPKGGIIPVIVKAERN
ncbi:phosphomutase [Yamadazyma tenuis]|nr:phosphomutase [Yamadazyma tenuis]